MLSGDWLKARAADVPPATAARLANGALAADLPGVMPARQVVTARLEDDGPYQRLFRLWDDGRLTAIVEQE